MSVPFYGRERELGLEIIKEMKQKIKTLSLPRGYSIRPVLIHVNGVKPEVEEQEFFANIIDFSQLLNN